MCDTGEETSSMLIKDLLRQAGGAAVIDGGLATELERHGADLNDPLWSAKCLLTSAHLIRTVHLDYLEAGADIIISASYQATIQGFEARGYSREAGEALLKRSVEIASEARAIYYERCIEASGTCSGGEKVLKHRPILVAASVGSYGAYLADGSEYSCPTFSTMVITFWLVPHFVFMQAYAELLEEEDIKIPAWFSFNSKDGVNVVSGDSLTKCASIAESCNKVVAVGINCTPPRFIHGLLLALKKVTTKPILIYPNSGESYDPDQKKWVQNTGVTDKDFVSYVDVWCDVGASLVGGCCRTTPDTIRAIYRTLSSRCRSVLPS
ncbi:Homocysteine S-methyltransferase 2 [Tripterygium wilfordii]|uniref:Homocysteine S-methyltransferase 2 n=1 Tax=Tripterygium wilfordii TaxID=458696 RepID=A0A7J7CXR0_TRIWF|nr:Homocysteine S-methyltransferase 2 [Tripterygium wilfordii]